MQINEEIKIFYKTLFKENIEKISIEHALFSETFPLPILNKNKIYQAKEIS